MSSHSHSHTPGQAVHFSGAPVIIDREEQPEQDYEDEDEEEEQNHMQGEREDIEDEDGANEDADDLKRD
jgi:hypothetical protein